MAESPAQPWAAAGANRIQLCAAPRDSMGNHGAGGDGGRAGPFPFDSSMGAVESCFHG